MSNGNSRGFLFKILNLNQKKKIPIPEVALTDLTKKSSHKKTDIYMS